MFRRERRQKILGLLDLYGRVEVEDLSKRFGVGQDSIRKDLQDLAKAGKLTRVYGGATRIETDDSDADPEEAGATPHHRAGTPSPVTVNPVGHVPVYSAPAPGGTAQDQDDIGYSGRLAVARRAYVEINEGDSIFLDISRTNALLADIIARGTKRVIVTTNMIEVLQKLSNLDHVTALGTGGYLNMQLNGFVGSATISLLEPLLFSKAFIGASGIDLNKSAVTSNDIDSGSVKETVIHNASYKFLLADASKFGRAGAFRFASLNDFSAVITDSRDPEVLNSLRRMGIPTLRSLPI